MPRKDEDVHDWTPFELHTLLCLMARGYHLGGIHKRTKGSTKDELQAAASRHAYLDLATKLNETISRGNFINDIPVKSIFNKIDEILETHKGPVAYMERQRVGRMTRGLKYVFARSPPIGFTGTKAEWDSGRKEKVMEEELAKRTAVSIAAMAAADDTSNGMVLPSLEGTNPQTSTSMATDLNLNREAWLGGSPTKSTSYTGNSKVLPTNGKARKSVGAVADISGDPVDQFFDQWERELVTQPSLAPATYMSSSRLAMINSANNEDPSDQEACGIDYTKQQTARGENTVPLPFNRMER
ncbi:hypothetical protein BP6252_12796 [Coleophoma cylindrospora]|uniref:Uncharacterized protein n=1 Tax=Coleophoma cylindrospora TaxID=1849047 RepID=A0A3D8QD32_9HELO|nr:hypothetical protein BP6252_12796 [Coleophoma cylindrospora]